MMRNLLPPLLCAVLAPLVCPAQSLPEGLRVEEGFPNAVTIEKNGKRLAVNRAVEDKCDTLLLTHARRDITRAAGRSGADTIVASGRSREFLENAPERWTTWRAERFDYYKQQVTQWPTESLPADRYLDPEAPGNVIEWEGLSIRALDTPGYTRDGTTYLVELDGRKVAFVGDLVLAGGRVRDLYSFQDEIREAKVGGYHGHLGRLARWLESVEAVAAEEPDLLVPARGPISRDPAADLARAGELARSIYRNYLSTNALHWYFGEERMDTCAERVLGPDHGLTGMPFAEHVDLPGWCHHIGTTKLLVSESGNGFVLDVGGPRSLETLRQVVADGLVQKIDGIFATHTHNDHTAAIGEAAREFGAPVYAIAEVADVIVHPGRWFLPGVSPNAVDEVTTVDDGHAMEWEEFAFTFRFFPGQMYNHGALLVEKPGHDPVFFIGDSFSPSGIDDYCLMNRNLMREDTGYELCFRIVEELPGKTWLVNQHIPHLFRFNEEELSFLSYSYRERAELIAGFVAWDDVNYAVDAQWASFYPYGQSVKAGETARTEVRIWNHSSVERTFTIAPRCSGASPLEPVEVTVPARERASVSLEIPIPVSGGEVYVVTADITRDDGAAEIGFCETILQVERP